MDQELILEELPHSMAVNEYSMTVKLPTEHHLEFLGLKGGCTGSFESMLVKMPHCWKSHIAAQVFYSTWLLAHETK